MPALSKYLLPKNYLRRIRWLLNRHLLAHLEEIRRFRKESRLAHPPIFVLGAPRSGSTLIVQVITESLDIGYISNRHCLWFGAPALAERLFRPLANKPASDYQSEYGSTNDLHAPAECGEWWYRFFRRSPPYVTLDDVNPSRMRAFRCSVAAFTEAFNRPVLFKNLYASLRIRAIAKYLPESLFIIISRDEVDNGHSLLEARFKRFADYGQWFSVEPPETERLKLLPAHEQVIEQIRHIYATIDSDLRLSGVPLSRCFDLNYEEFCSDPSGKIDSILAFLKSHGCRIERRNSVPVRFERRSTVRINPDIYRSMVEYSRGSI